MNVEKLDDGLWRWSTHFGEWGHEVGSIYLETDEEIVLIDPLVPEEPDEEARFWRALDRDVARHGGPVHALSTVFWHVRSTARMVERFDARVHAASGVRAAVERRAGRVDATYRGVAELPGGVVAHPTGSRSESALWIPAHRTLVTGDVIHGTGDALELCPPSWLTPGHTSERLREALQPLRDLPVERVLTSHGAPVLEHGQAALGSLLGGP
ncbi:MAG: hypothetical protein U0R50_01850 [Gaiellales bacterium]